MHILVDAMGGDKAPKEIVKGALMASQKYGIDISLVGIEEEIRPLLSACEPGYRLKEIIPASEVIEMEDDPLSALRLKRDASMIRAIQRLKTDGDAMVSAGSTGALLVASTHYLRNVRGISRAAIATMLPFEHPKLLLDSGANLGVNKDYLVQWALLGSIYMKNILKIDSPRVALLNNGMEANKGLPELVETYRVLKERTDIRFVGNIEARDIPTSSCDVIVTDGFSGNVVIKLLEGMTAYSRHLLSDVFRKGPVQKLAYLGVKEPLRKSLSALMEHTGGGAPILGLTAPVIKAHGNSDAADIVQAIGQAVAFASSEMIKTLERIDFTIV